MRRIAVVGSSGSGKTTLARQLADKLGLEHIELDALFHQPNWQPLDTDAFRANLQSAMQAAPQGWTMCGAYNSKIGDIRDAGADTIVWLDLPRATIMRQLIRRTLRRGLRRQELWNGNRESLATLLRWDPNQNLIRWSWVHFERRRAQFEQKVIDGDWDHLDLYRLRSRVAVDAFAAKF